MPVEERVLIEIILGQAVHWKSRHDYRPGWIYSLAQHLDDFQWRSSNRPHLTKGTVNKYDVPGPNAEFVQSSLKDGFIYRKETPIKELISAPSELLHREW